MEPNVTKFNLIILGASGFTGKYVLKETLKFLNNSQSPLNSIAIAGRNPTKLSQTLKWATLPNPPQTIPILSADTSDSSSLCSLCSQTRLILNCVGLFRLHGEPVVYACVDSCCDYLDICSEPKFMERMESDYHDRRGEAGSLVVSACGFDSVLAEIGLLFNSLQWAWGAILNRVVAYVSLDSRKRIVGNFATYESVVLGVANAKYLQAFRRSTPRRRPRPQAKRLV